MDDHKDVTVKAMSIAAWERGHKRRAARGESMATWLARAIHHQADIEERDGIMPPTHMPPAPIGVSPVLDLAQAAQLAQLTALLTEAAERAGAAQPKGTVNESKRIIARTIRVLAGKPADRPARRGNRALPAPDNLAALTHTPGGYPENSPALPQR